MSDFNLKDPLNMLDPYENKCLIKISLGERTKIVYFYYDDKEAPKDTDTELEWIRERVMEFLDEERDLETIESVKIAESFRYVSDGRSDDSYYA